MSSKPTLFLMGAIIAEVIATTALARSESFTKIFPSMIVVVGYIATYWLLSFPLQIMPTGVVYAIWSGIGIVLITIVAWIWFREPLDLPALIGIALILAGVAVVNLFSKTMSH